MSEEIDYSLKKGTQLTLLSELANLRRFFGGHPLTSSAPHSAWFRFASWQFRSRFREEIEFDWIGGQRLAVRRGMAGATGNIYVGLHEFYDMMLLLHLLRPGDLFLDIGANVGTYTVLASGVCRAKTRAFEPDVDTLRHLKKNIEINKLDGLVVVHECALGAATGEIAFTVGQDTVNRIATEGAEKTRMVRIERLDTIVADASPIMMKVDVEGAEQQVLLGAEKVLADPGLRVIELETVTEDIAAIMARNGFEMAFYNPWSRRLDRHSSGHKSSNSLFVRDWPFVEARLKSAQGISVLGRTI
jgi:FkbM family methyltransferase